jgi:hypothetical protein
MSSITVVMFADVEVEPLKGMSGALYESIFVAETSSMGAEILYRMELGEDDCLVDGLPFFIEDKRVVSLLEMSGALYESEFVVETSSIGAEIMCRMELGEYDCFVDGLRFLIGGERVLSLLGTQALLSDNSDEPSSNNIEELTG